MLQRLLLTLPLLMLTQCTPTSGTRHAAAPPPAPVEAQQQVPAPPSAEQIEFFNRALDQA